MTHVRLFNCSCHIMSVATNMSTIGVTYACTSLHTCLPYLILTYYNNTYLQWWSVNSINSDNQSESKQEMGYYHNKTLCNVNLTAWIPLNLFTNRCGRCLHGIPIKAWLSNGLSISSRFIQSENFNIWSNSSCHTIMVCVVQSEINFSENTGHVKIEHDWIPQFLKQERQRWKSVTRVGSGLAGQSFWVNFGP